MRKWTYKAGLPLLVLAAVGLGFLLYKELFPQAAPASDRTTWVWSLEDLLQENGGSANVIAFLEENRTRTVYVHVEDTLQKAAVSDAYRDFIRLATEAGIRIHALGGDRNWALESGRQSLMQFLSLVAEYNEAVPEASRFTGVHLDVEPYLLDEWEADRDGVVDSWREMTEAFVSYSEAHGLETGMDIPFWLDSVPAGDDNENDGVRTLDQWMMARTDSVTLMSYRNETGGDDGVLAIVKDELAHAGQAGRLVYVGLNTAKDEEEKLTFYERSTDKLGKAMRRIDAEYAGHAGYAGIAVHDLAAWMRKSAE